MRRTSLGLAVLVGVGAALVVTRESLADAWANLRRYSAPGAGLYDGLAGPLLGSFYELVAADVVAALADDDPSGTVLEVGPGPGHLAVTIAQRAPGVRVVGVDLDPAMVERARERAARAGVDGRVSFEQGDVAELPLADGSVDLVVSTFSLHHWADRVGGLEELRRVLRPGGMALVFDLHRAWVRLETGGLHAEAAARASGFRDVRTTGIGWPFGLPLVVRVELEKAADSPGPG
jgi:ubiquinone/menaquinone biosynthesis C-methylase UbiE